MPPPLRCPSLFSSVSCKKQVYTASQSRSFSATPKNNQRVTRARRQLFQWLTDRGTSFYMPLQGSTNYLGAYDKFGELRRVVESRAERAGERDAAKKQAEAEGREHRPSKDGDKSKEKIPPETNRDLMPFPSNNKFVSQSVLSEELREEIWERIMRVGVSVRQVSADLGVEMSRVGAVVRLKEIEKEWERIGKPLARPYARAVLGMLPKTLYDPRRPIQPHESINDLPVHASTIHQMFYPTSESRVFTRKDAARAFNDHLLPADNRIPHPELIATIKEEILQLSPEERQARAEARAERENAKRQRALDLEAQAEAAIQRIDKGRFEFRITEVNVDDAGKTGRGIKAVGWRYGHPNMDRKKGSVKIPTSVE